MFGLMLTVIDWLGVDYFESMIEKHETAGANTGCSLDPVLMHWLIG